jgi:uncharacterized membrane protein YidH (DUF202 family)
MSDGSKVDRSQTDPRVSLAENRTGMATYRTSLALERTTLAWIRTTLTMSSFGLGMIGFFRTVRLQSETPESIRMHEGAIRFGVALDVAAEHHDFSSALTVGSWRIVGVLPVRF